MYNVLSDLICDWSFALFIFQHVGISTLHNYTHVCEITSNKQNKS